MFWRAAERRYSLALLLLVAAAVIVAVAGILIERQRDHDRRAALAYALTGGHADRGKAIFLQYGCSGCHELDGVRGARGLVGPDLTHVGERAYIAGSLRNTPHNLIRWIEDPQAVEPGNVMPDLGLSNQQARDVAAFLYQN